MNATRPALVKLTREQSDLIFGKLFKDTGFEPSTRSLERQGDQRLCLLSNNQTRSIHDQLNLIKWAKYNLSDARWVGNCLAGSDDALNAFLDALNVPAPYKFMWNKAILVTNLLPCDGLTAFKVHYDNGESQVTSMAEGTTWEAAYNYYVGKTFTYERPNGEEYHLKCVRITQIG